MVQREESNASRNVSNISWIIILTILLFAPVLFNSIDYLELKTLIQIAFLMILIMAVANALFIGKYYQLKFELHQLKEKNS